MEDSNEARGSRNTTTAADFDAFLTSVKTSIMEELGAGEDSRFLDPHVEWSLESVQYNSGNDSGVRRRKEDIDAAGSGDNAESRNIEEETKRNDDDDDDDEKSKEEDSSTVSDDSDDYSFLFHHTTEQNDTSTAPSPTTYPSFPEPPVMIVTSPHDIVLVRTLDADDAVSHARRAGKHATALQRALEHRRSLRRYRLNELVDEYFTAMLSLSSSSSSSCGPLTVRRLQSAARATPTLLGGCVKSWEKWTKEFLKIPGGLFVLWDRLPVRDPKLPSRVHDLVLRNMFIEIRRMPSSSSSISPTDIDANTSEVRRRAAIDLYLAALRSWGTVSSLKERIKIYGRPFLSTSSSKRDSNGGARERNGVRVVRETVRAEAERALSLRTTQSAAMDYLRYANSSPSSGTTAVVESTGAAAVNSIHHPTGTTFDALYDVSIILDHLTNFLVSAGDKSDRRTGDQTPVPEAPFLPTRNVAMQAIAELYFMKGDYEEALRAHLSINPRHGTASEEILSRVENMAIDSIYNQPNDAGIIENDPEIPGGVATVTDFERYGHVLAMMETHTMHRVLLDEDFFSSEPKGFWSENTRTDTFINNPVVALVCLVGLDLAGHFLLEHCTLPKSRSGIRRSTSTGTLQSTQSYGSASSSSSSALPIDMLAAQLRSRPKLLHWFLNLVFWKKPEVYVKFPNTAIPPSTVTDLHRLHFELHVEFSPDRRSSPSDGRVGRTDASLSVRQRLAAVPSYEDVDKESPLMSFLKAVLPHGGLRFNDVRETFEQCRFSPSKYQEKGKTISSKSKDRTSGPPKYPHLFARELAFMIEWSDQSATDDKARSTEDAKTILHLYLEGVVSLPLAVAYAERNTSHSVMLWEMLASYCLGTTTTTKSSTDGSMSTLTDGVKKASGGDEPETDGALFGSLLEVAARSGADLAHLIVCVPPEMRIEGIRPKLVAAISDYRLKLKIHEAASEVFVRDKVSLLRDQCHLARRGLRIDLPTDTYGVVDEKEKNTDDVVEDDRAIVSRKEMLEQKRKRRQLLMLRNERTPCFTPPMTLTIR